KNMGRKVIVLSCYRGTKRRFMEVLNSINDMSELYAPWGSPALVKRSYVYLSNGKSIFVIDTATSKMLPPLHFWGRFVLHIAGIIDGTIIGRGKCKKSGKYHLMTAQLPHEYVAKVQSVPVTSAIDAVKGGFTSKFQDEFEVKKTRGEGGFGCVFEAVNKYDKWEYAVKRVAIDVRDEESALREVWQWLNLTIPLSFATMALGSRNLLRDGSMIGMSNCLPSWNCRKGVSRILIPTARFSTSKYSWQTTRFPIG
ncbi:hypothetical protein PENTCL1PPCAC_8510, partial [Pristionchus entomophagus]